MAMFHRSSPDPAPGPQDPGVQLVRECEAFLAGRMASHLAAQGRAVPTWAHLNRLAHCRPESIVALAAGDAAADDGHGVGGTWAPAEALIAHEMVRAAGTAAGIFAVQQAVIVPIELRFAALSTSADAWIAPERLLPVVLDGLERFSATA